MKAQTLPCEMTLGSSQTASSVAGIQDIIMNINRHKLSTTPAIMGSPKKQELKISRTRLNQLSTTLAYYYGKTKAETQNI